VCKRWPFWQMAQTLKSKTRGFNDEAVKPKEKEIQDSFVTMDSGKRKGGS
jgi:hypothetical protein